MKNYKIPLIILLTSITVRLFYYFLNDLVVGSDAAEYVKLARRLASGDIAGGLSTYWAPLFPFLIAVPSIFTDSYLLPTLIVSIITGSLAAIATFYLVKQSYGKREAVIAATIAIFYPHLLHSTFNLDTGNVYLLLISLSIITFWKGLTADSVKNFFLTGILLGLSYLTRPEAFGYLFFFIPWLGLSKFFSGQKVFSRNLPKNAAILLFGFALMATPYIFYLRSATDTWTISGKFKRHVIGDETFSDKKRAYDKALEAPNYISETGKIFLKITFFNLHSIHKKVSYLFPPFLLIFVGIGLFRTNWTGSRFKREIYLFSFCATTVLGYTLSVNNVVYFYVLLPILIGWVARGIVEMEVWWRESFQIFPINKRFISNLPIFSILFIILINIYVLPLNNFMRSTEGAWKFSHYEQKAAGLWLKENAKTSPVIMSVDYRPAFYAEGEHIPLTSNTLDEALTEAIAKRVDFLVIDERNIKDTPQLIGLLNEPQNYPKLELVYQAATQPGYKIVIYRVKTDVIP